MSDNPPNQPPQLPTSNPKRKKLPTLPPNAKVHKRPLLHPPIPSPYTGTQQQKIIYISTKTPFLSAVKRAEKLLQLSEKRLVQSATTLAKQNRGKGKRKRGRGEEDEILEIAETVEAEKKKRKIERGGNDGGGGGEEVVLKGTGKAIQKVLELGLWFQQREEYTVRLRTGSVGAIDDIVVGEDDVQVESATDAVAGAEGGEGDAMDVEAQEARTDNDENGAQKPNGRRKKNRSKAQPEEPLPETRIRYASVLEVAVSLR